MCVSAREREKQKIEFLRLIFSVCWITGKLKQRKANTNHCGIHDTAWMASLFILFIHVEKRKKKHFQVGWHCFGWIFFCVGWENVANAVRGQMGEMFFTEGTNWIDSFDFKCASIVCKSSVFNTPWWHRHWFPWILTEYLTYLGQFTKTQACQRALEVQWTSKFGWAVGGLGSLCLYININWGF